MRVWARAGYFGIEEKDEDLELFDEGMSGQSSRQLSSSREDCDRNVCRCAIDTPFVADEKDVGTNTGTLR